MSEPPKRPKKVAQSPTLGVAYQLHPSGSSKFRRAAFPAARAGHRTRHAALSRAMAAAAASCGARARRGARDPARQGPCCCGAKPSLEMEGKSHKTQTYPNTPCTGRILAYTGGVVWWGQCRIFVHTRSVWDRTAHMCVSRMEHLTRVGWASQIKA